MPVCSVPGRIMPVGILHRLVPQGGGALMNDTVPTPDRTEVLKYLGDTYTYYGRYHDHKETSAWVAVALWITAMGTVIVHSVKEDPTTYVGRIGLGLLIIVLGFSFFSYVLTQLRQRSHASDVVAAASYLSVAIIGGKRGLTHLDFEVQSETYRGDKDWHCFPSCLLKEIRNMRVQDREIRARLECLAYSLLAVSSIAALVKLAWPLVEYAFIATSK